MIRATAASMCRLSPHRLLLHGNVFQEDQDPWYDRRPIHFTWQACSATYVLPPQYFLPKLLEHISMCR